MRHVVVGRATVLFGADLVLYAAGFPWRVRDEASAPGGAESPSADSAKLFQQHCGGCHAADDLRPQVREGGADGRAALETFLRDHGEAADAEDRVILDYLGE